MLFIRRAVYLVYYFKELDWQKLKIFMAHAKKQTGLSSLSLWFRMIASSLQYNISLLEYFQFRFFEISDSEKETFAGTGTMYEYQLKMNPKVAREVLSDKRKFLKEYAPFVGHRHVTLKELQNSPQSADVLLQNPSGKIVLKRSDGQCGIGVLVQSVDGMNSMVLVDKLKKSGNDLVEEFVVQHDDLMRLSPSGLNTIRIITQLNNSGGVDVLGARLRISVNSVVDNLAAGNLAAVINLETGRVEGPGVYSDITKDDKSQHPVTGVPILGFHVPFWQEALVLVKAAALHNSLNRSIGWDVAITNAGPQLIEGNHDWCKLLWQLPEKRGLKQELEKYSVIR